MVIVRSLWFTHSLQYAKVMRDITHAPRVSGCETIVFAFDNIAASHLRACGVAHAIMRDSSRPSDYTPGASQWWHKLVAVREAARISRQSVLHLDWDTSVTGTMPELDSSGPVIQGRLKSYKKTQWSPRKPYHVDVYHGGCFYVRDEQVASRVLSLHASVCPKLTDEVALTLFADTLVGNTSPQSHRDQGYDNPRLYSARGNALPSDEQSAFSEGRVIRPAKFAVALSALLLRSIKRGSRRQNGVRGIRKERAIQQALRDTTP